MAAYTLLFEVRFPSKHPKLECLLSSGLADGRQSWGVDRWHVELIETRSIWIRQQRHLAFLNQSETLQWPPSILSRFNKVYTVDRESLKYKKPKNLCK